MANEKKEWEEKLIKVNEELKDKGYKLEVMDLDEGYFALNILQPNGLTYEYAANYFEKELCDLIEEAHNYIIRKNERTVWVFTRDMAWDCEILHNEIRVFDHKDDAVKALKEWRDDEIKTDQEAGWIIETDTDELFEAYEEGYYTGNHSVGKITEVTVE